MRAILFFILAVSAFAEVRLVFLGDSLTEGLGVAQEEAYPVLVQSILHSQGRTDVVCLNASVSGSTSKSLKSRLAWQLKQKPDMVFLALGANDGLRGLDLKELEGNLNEGIETLLSISSHRILPVLAGMQLPVNYGAEYTRQFAAVYPRLAEKHAIPIYPFLLSGVATDPKLNQTDGIHPNSAGQTVIASQVAAFLLPLIQKEFPLPE